MNKEIQHGSVRSVKLILLSNNTATINLLITLDFSTSIKITDEGPIEDLQKKYGFTKAANGDFETESMINELCSFLKEGDKFHFLGLHSEAKSDSTDV